MQGDFSRLMMKMKALDRWENEGGRIYTGVPPMTGSTSMNMQTSKDNDGAQFHGRTKERTEMEDRGVVYEY